MGPYRKPLILVSVLVLVGCAAGREFARPPQESLILGKTSYREIIERFGPPFREATMTVNERPLKTVTYGYSVGRARGVAARYDGVTPEKAMSYFFMNDVLVGHRFISSFKEDHTDYDETKVTEIRRGETTGNGVITLLGSPHGRQTYPLIKGQDDTALVYAYVHTKVRPGLAGPKVSVYRKILVVAVDKNDVVTDVEFTTEGEK